MLTHVPWPTQKQDPYVRVSLRGQYGSTGETRPVKFGGVNVEFGPEFNPNHILPYSLPPGSSLLLDVEAYAPAVTRLPVPVLLLLRSLAPSPLLLDDNCPLLCRFDWDFASSSDLIGRGVVDVTQFVGECNTGEDFVVSLTDDRQVRGIHFPP